MSIVKFVGQCHPSPKKRSQSLKYLNPYNSKRWLLSSNKSSKNFVSFKEEKCPDDDYKLAWF